MKIQRKENDKPYSANDPIRVATEKNIGKGINNYVTDKW